ncbi:MAG: fimbrillin family protein [Tannerellaceae bacterium]|jgi:hypothetical protein|nr:fimbrillin family protein [Tannerellaceae bacterium]
MKRMNFLTMATLVASAMFISCNNHDDEVGNNANAKANRVEVKFSANTAQLTTRVSGTNWAAMDPIGIYMLKSNYTLNSDHISEGVNNRRYMADSDGSMPTFTPVDGMDGTIYYPTAGNVKFIAYYPYNASVTNFETTVSLADQTDLSAIDLMYAAPTEEYSEDSEIPVALTFKHKLVKLLFNLSNGAGVTTSVDQGIRVDILGQKTQATLNLSDASVTPSGDTNAIMLEGGATIQGIVLPNENFSNMSFAFTNKANETFTSKIPDSSSNWESGYMYTYHVTLQKNEAVIKGTISAWGEGTNGTVTAK